MLSDKIEDDNILFLDVHSYRNNIRFVVVFNHLITLIPWFTFNIIYITSFIIEYR